MAIHVIIPARYGSSRFPGKPLVDIAGKPMVQQVMERAARAPGVRTVAVATDDQRIQQAVEAFGGLAVMTPSQVRTGSDRVAAAADILDLADGELVVNVQGDQPLLPPEVIAETVAPLLADPTLGMATPVTPFKDPADLDDPTNVKVVMDLAGDALYFSRQTIPHAPAGHQVTFFKHLGVYAFRREFLRTFSGLPTGRLEAIERLEQLRVLEAGHRLRCVISQHDSPEVDRPEHAAQVARLLAGVS